MRVVHFESDGGKFGAGFDFLLHDDGKIVFDVRIVHAGIEIGVARDAHHHAVFDGITGEREAAERLYKLFRQNDLRLFAPADAESTAGLKNRIPIMRRPSLSSSYIM